MRQISTNMFNKLTALLCFGDFVRQRHFIKIIFYEVIAKKSLHCLPFTTIGKFGNGAQVSNPVMLL
jgi:hypothetical protein